MRGIPCNERHPVEPQTYALIGVAVTFAIFLLGGAFGLGKLFQRVDTIAAELSELAAEVRQLATEVRRTNEIAVALANHRHDVDGNTVFAVPSGGD